ncbi:serine protease, S9A family peptidase [Mesorhizobium australicum WSM2073]|uniref:Serine protease, S9A family peptidase n=3 Tax=Mesorhizobium TaxID=68287 RepID=L0KVK7_MESAW|nr:MULTISPECIES: prolyl oligopeptidase family serine peptidase [Mesorhizobium]ADV14750.1 Prolyl oligopeptidase [Mesorhizobium ciceri biovar biserrulae WSM1271]AEH90637.1 Prolyl oligopeptidase [Mesorhizobium opportunistum WSM2075]AGB48009.1 serine protease, S9A family peptidase [Mesorhizobium australicum WSM2073]OBP89898.1 peptidase S9 [Mesorhizobium loti]
MSEFDFRPTLNAPDDDPHLWLEDVEGERALAWTASQSAKTLKHFAGTQFERDRAVLRVMFDRFDRIPLVTRRGQYLYNFWQDAGNPRGQWRRTTLAAYMKADPQWELLVDLDALAASDGEDWIWGGASIEPETRERAVLRLSRGGSDAVVHREFDLSSLSIVADGFNLPEAKGGINWLDPDTLLLFSALGHGMATRSGFARTLRLWKRGADPLTAPVIFRTGSESLSVSGHMDHTVENERLWFIENTGFFKQIVQIGDRSGPKLEINLPRDAWWASFGDWLAVKPRKPWTVRGTTHPADALIGISLSSFIGGERRFSTLFEPGERRCLQSFFWNDGKLIIAYLENLAPRFEVLTPGHQEWTRRALDAVPAQGTVHLWSLDAADHETNGEVFVSAQDPITPSKLLLLDLNDAPPLGAPVVLKRSPENFDASGLVVTRHEAVSIDDELIPYTQVGPANGNGDAPVHLSAYGGFGISLLPHYNSSLGKLWLERGGTCVVANIRGGGEFGTRWHDAGRREGKRLAHDDFAAVAADLVRRGITLPRRIAAEGGSNGGLLIANMLTRYPEHFGALFCTVPLIDMRRYTKLLAGASWIDEYGDPEKAEDWAFLKELSAYHAATPGQPYPPMLLATTKRDDRVHPGHARKMTAKLQALGYPAYFYEPVAGGHGHGKDNRERAAFISLGINFLRSAIGWHADSFHKGSGTRGGRTSDD